MQQTQTRKKILASADSREEMIKLITWFYPASAITIDKDGFVFDDKRRISDTRVIKRRKKLHFVEIYQNASYVSVWDGGTRAITSCYYHPQTGKVNDIESAESIEGLDILDEEFIELNSGIVVRNFITEDGRIIVNGQAREETTLEKWNRLMGKYKSKWNGRIDVVLWQIVVNGACDKKRSCFVSLHSNLAIGIADFKEKGYHPIHIEFKADLNMKQRSQLLQEFNHDVFGLTSKETDIIEASSYRRY